MWLKSAAPDLLKGLEKVEKEKAGNKKVLHKALMSSGQAIRTLLAKSAQADGRIKGFKPHVFAFLGYLISHESDHRGQIVLSLKQSGHQLDKKVLFGIWEWGSAVTGLAGCNLQGTRFSGADFRGWRSGYSFQQ